MFTTVHTHTKQDGVLSSVIPFVEQKLFDIRAKEEFVEIRH